MHFDVIRFRVISEGQPVVLLTLELHCSFIFKWCICFLPDVLTQERVSGNSHQGLEVRAGRYSKIPEKALILGGATSKAGCEALKTETGFWCLSQWKASGQEIPQKEGLEVSGSKGNYAHPESGGSTFCTAPILNPGVKSHKTALSCVCTKD